jgi:tetratricopeptide (TPR) repeat protein
MFRRLHRPPEPPRPQLILRRAHQLMEQGHYAEAAELFEQLAQGAESRGMLDRAGELHLQAGRARLENGQVQPALAHSKHALGCFLRAGRPGRAFRTLPRVLEELRSRGYTAEAEALQQEIQERFGQAGLEFRPATAAVPGQRRSLPGKCDSCGGTLRSDEVEWIDATTAECPYCGSSVKAA